MVTCAQVGTVKPNPRFNFHTSYMSPLPKSPSIGLSNPNWRVAMYDEYNALVKNNGSLSRYKARLVANGCTQHVGIDCDDTFSSVVRPTTIQTVLSLALSRKWHVHQLDVKNVFLNGDISETIYMAHMANCNPTRMPVDTESKLGSDRDIISNLALYRSLTALKRVLQYVGGTLDFGLQLYASITGDNLLSRSAKQQQTLSRLSAEAEYRGVANVVAETAWLRNLLRELHTPLLSATLVYCDNVTAIYMTANPV
uniref:Ribonuclease H-like domain-containing protein n=1 Tax=Tanacetum cinerariifolium TaxID=118510 RepID=A0A6L2KLU3_TANCI|nr:ribonuclease H-like domain-containing protein [Tanacetum cinerariifolium]